jgi:hypothetical protein
MGSATMGTQAGAEVLDRYVGVYSSPSTHAKMTGTSDGGTLYIQAGSEQSAVPLEATAENTFKIDPAPVSNSTPRKAR